MKYLIIGLGIYGSNLATDLTDLGHEVIGADVNASLIEGIKDRISTAYVLDATDETALQMLPLRTVDLVIVAIGENFGASVRTVALLKKLEVKHIYARAVDKLHEAILEGFHIDRILTPEQRAARDLVLEMAFGAKVQTLKVSDKLYVVKLSAPRKLFGRRYADLDMGKTQLIAATRQEQSTNIVGFESRKTINLDLKDETLTVGPEDTLICLGSPSAVKSLTE